MKEVQCAACGLKLDLIRKADPSTGKLLNLVIPHVCGELGVDIPIEEKETVVNPVDKVFGALPFVDKINKAESPQPILDRRPRESQRKELESTAPSGLRDYIKNLGGGTPVQSGRELVEPDE